MVYPRDRGEYLRTGRTSNLLFSSSPHLRGTLLQEGQQARDDRFIPAHAGNTSSRRTTRGRAPVHPRTCGEHIAVVSGKLKQVGSSRTCGEHLLVISSMPLRYGSSPHPRGTHVVDDLGNLVVRFIPAPAGNTPGLPSTTTWHPVHPRTRGEHFTGDRKAKYIDGSSPHPRGTHDDGAGARVDCRFIPAPAGNTRSGNSSLTTMAGSSPHPRGTRCWPRCQPRNCRFIPAPAGNTAFSQPPMMNVSVHPRTRALLSGTPHAINSCP